MKIVVNTPPTKGVPIRTVAFGAVVTRPINEVYYLVGCFGDGTGHRILVTLGSGNITRVDQDTEVIPVEATLHVGDGNPQALNEPARPAWCPKCQGLWSPTSTESKLAERPALRLLVELYLAKRQRYTLGRWQSHANARYSVFETRASIWRDALKKAESHGYSVMEFVDEVRRQKAV